MPSRKAWANASPLTIVEWLRDGQYEPFVVRAARKRVFALAGYPKQYDMPITAKNADALAAFVEMKAVYAVTETLTQ